jgi:hypothetical protein
MREKGHGKRSGGEGKPWWTERRRTETAWGAREVRSHPFSVSFRSNGERGSVSCGGKELPQSALLFPFWDYSPTLFQPSFLFFHSLPLPSSFLSLRPYIPPVSELALTLIFTQPLSAVARGLTGGKESRARPSPRRSISTRPCSYNEWHLCTQREHSRSASYDHSHTSLLRPWTNRD